MMPLHTIIPHDGGECPVGPMVPVYPSYRGPIDPAKGVRIACAPAWRLDWSHDGSDDDIIGYAIARDLMPARAAERGK